MLTRRRIVQSSLLTVGALALSKTLVVKSATNTDYGIVGRTAPELEIDYWIDRHGNPTSFSLTEHKGKWVFLKCFQSWCPGCHSHGLPAVKKISDALENNPRVVFAGIQTVFEGFGTNTVDKVRKVQLQYDLQFPMGHDPGEPNGHPATMINYRTGGTPWMILIDPHQEVVYNDFGIDADKVIDFLVKQTN